MSEILFEAVDNGDIEWVKALVAKGADVKSVQALSGGHGSAQETWCKLNAINPNRGFANLYISSHQTSPSISKYRAQNPLFTSHEP